MAYYVSSVKARDLKEHASFCTLNQLYFESCAATAIYHTNSGEFTDVFMLHHQYYSAELHYNELNSSSF